MKIKIRQSHDLVSGPMSSNPLSVHECKTHLDLIQIVDELKGKKIIIYGAGKIGERVNYFFSRFGIPVSFFWDVKAEAILELGGLPVLKPDFEQIPQEDREQCFIIVTVFSENICHMVQDKLFEAGFCHTITDRKMINSLIYFKCQSDIHEKKFRFDLTTCFFCPNAKGSKNRCEIFDEKMKTNILTDESSLDREKAFFIPSMGVLISTKCNLLCQGCNHLREHYQSSDNVDIETEQILSDLRRILDAVDFIHTLVIVGGESFLHRDFKNIIASILCLPKIGNIQIITNGTVVPKNEEIFALLSRPRVIVEISGYGDKIQKKLQENVRLFISKLDQFKVNYRYAGQMQWFDFGSFEDRNYSNEALSRVYSSCICVSNDLFDGKLHKCSRSVFATSLKKIPDFPSDYVDVRHTSEGNLRMKLVEFFEKEIVEACRFCNGTFTKTIEAGEQVSDRTIASHSRLVAEASLTLGETINDKT